MNQVIPFHCANCHAVFHSRCIWGQFFIVTPAVQSSPNRFWLCGHCLVNKALELYDFDLKDWIPVFVTGYYHTSNQHAVKRQDSITLLRLGQYRIRFSSQSEFPIDNTLCNESVIQVQDGIRQYKYSNELINYHSQPQIVGLLILFHSSSPIEPIQIPKMR